MSNNSNGWIFSRKIDLIVFLLPFIGLIWFAYMGFNYGLDTKESYPHYIRVGFIMEGIFVLFMDVPHVYATFTRPFISDVEELRSRKKIYLILPVVILFGLLSLDAINPSYVYTTVLYLNIFHFVRQQYGWMKITERKSNVLLSNFRRKFETLTIYTVMIAPIIWWKSNPMVPSHKYFLSQGDMRANLPGMIHEYILPGVSSNILSELLTKGSLFILAFFLIGYLGLVGWDYIKGSPINYAKVLVMLTTAAAWSGGIILLNGEVMFLDILHVVPYIYLLYSYGYIKVDKLLKPSFIQSVVFKSKYSFIYYLGLIILLGFAAEQTINHQSYIFMYTIAVYHYIVDGYLWGRRYNNERMKETNLA